MSANRGRKRVTQCTFPLPRLLLLRKFLLCSVVPIPCEPSSPAALHVISFVRVKEKLLTRGFAIIEARHASDLLSGGGEKNKKGEEMES